MKNDFLIYPKLFLFLLIVCTCCQCKNESHEKVNPVIALKDKIIPPSFDKEQHLKDYENLKERISIQRKTLKATQASDAFSSLLVDSIFKYWYKTPWDFNGHTTEPRNGEIACGYFVTTTLRDVGIKLQRIKLAQQASSVMIQKLCAKNSIKRLGSFNKLEQYFEAFPDNYVFILGLDFHVGFVVKRNDKLYFIHSSYEGEQIVKSEILSNSAPVIHSKSYMIGCLNQHQQLLKQWIQN